MAGHVRRRGKRSWELKFDAGFALNGKRKTNYRSFKGSKKEAEIELAKLISAAAKGEHVDPSKVTVNEFLDRWEQEWATGHLGGKSFERYTELLRTHVRPHMGTTRLQRVRPTDLSQLYADLLLRGKKGQRQDGVREGLSPQTVAYVHRVLHRAFGHATVWGLTSSNPAASVEPPKLQRAELEILTEAQVKTVLQKLRGRPIYLIAALGLSTGMRRGELLALRWKNVDLETCKIQVEKSLEQTKAGLRLKTPKTRHGLRSLSVAKSVVAELKAHKAAQAEQRLALGLGKDQGAGLVFRRPTGEPMVPNSVSTDWRRLVRVLGLPKVSLHAWRHTHASQLIASGMDVLKISRRLGHGSPSITLDVYGHLFDSGDDRAASVFEQAYGATITE